MSTFLKVDGLSKSFGGFAALTQVSLDVAQGERFGLIGPNGSGKTTLINCVSGLLRNDAGSIRFEDEEISSYLSQEDIRRLTEPSGYLGLASATAEAVAARAGLPAGVAS